MTDQEIINIFDIAQKQYEENEAKIWKEKLTQTSGDKIDSDLTNIGDSCLIVCGSQNCGKSTMIARFMDTKNEPLLSNPTIALSYLYATKTRQNIRQLAHIWELGGGGLMSNLLQFPIKSGHFERTGVIVFLDLTRPETFQSIVEPILTQCQRRIDSILETLQTNKKELYERIISNGELNDLYQQLPNMDKRIVKPFQLKLIFIGARYDEFQNYNTERKKTTFRLLRFLAHINGASFTVGSSQMENLIQRNRALFSHFAFNTQNNRVLNVDVQQPINVPFGMDSIEKIDPSKEMSLEFLASYSDAMAHFFHLLEQQFPQKVLSSDFGEELSDRNQFPEPIIDSLVEEQAKRLELYVKEKSDRREAQQRAIQRMSGVETE